MGTANPPNPQKTKPAERRNPQMQTLETSATVAPVTSNEETALVAPRFTIVSPVELATGKCPKVSYVKGRIAAGVEKKQALAEYSAALETHRAENKCVLGATLGLAHVEVARITKTKTGWSARLVDTSAAREKAAEKAAERVAKLEAKLAEMRAKLASA